LSEDNSSFTYKGKAVDIKEVGRELGVRYVLEGTLQALKTHRREVVAQADVQPCSHDQMRCEPPQHSAEQQTAPREPRHHAPQFLQRAITTAPRGDDDDFDD